LTASTGNSSTLPTGRSVLDKAAAWAAARKVNEADLLNMRLSPDMFNLARQVRAATDHAANAAGRFAGKELLKFANDEATIAQLKRSHRQGDRLSQELQAERDRWHRGQGHQHHLPERPDAAVHRPEPTARQQPAKFLFSRNYCLPHHPAVRCRAWQTRFHGNTASILRPALSRVAALLPLSKAERP
jgi:Domain of unknown function (DUF1993)